MRIGKIETKYVRAEIKNHWFWPKRNLRRGDLWNKKQRGGLTKEEEAELQELTVELTMVLAVMNLPLEEHSARQMEQIKEWKREATAEDSGIDPSSLNFEEEDK